MIKAKYNSTSSTEVCAVSGDPFYAKEGLAFYLDGDTKKPVAPGHALRLGFTIDQDLYCFISGELRRLSRIDISKLISNE